MGTKKYFRALTVLNQAIDKAPLNAQLHLWRGNTYWAVCDYRRAIKDFDTAIRQSDSAADAYAHKAVCLARLGFADAAMTEFRAAAKKKTEDATVTLLIARALFENKDYKEAADYLSSFDDKSQDRGQATGQRELNASIYLTRAQSKAATGELDAALDDCNKALAVSPGFYLAYAARARIFQKQNQFEKAIADAKKALEINKKKFPLAHLIEAECFLALSKIGEAELELNLAWQELGNTPSGEAHYYRSQIAERKGNLLAGLPERAAALQLGYTDPPSITVLGREVLSADKIANSLAAIVVSERFICYSDLGQDKVERFSRLAEGFATYVSQNVCDLQGEYPAFLFILHDKGAEQHFLKDRMDFNLHVHGVFLTARNSVVTYEGAGVGTYLHEVMHKFLYNTKTHDFWADEGIPSFFEKSYGYLYKNNPDSPQNLYLLTGFADPSNQLWNWLTHKSFKLSQIVTSAKYADPNNEDAQRLVALFLNEQEKLKPFLDLTFKGARGKYKYFIEAVFNKPLAELDPMFESYLTKLHKNRAAISKLPEAAVFDTEAEFRKFVQENSIVKAEESAAK